MATTVRIPAGDSAQGKIVTLGSPRGKDDLAGLHTVEGRYLIAGLVDGLPGGLTQTIDARGIAELVRQVRHHRLEHLWIERRGGRMVEVHHRHHSMVSREP